MNRFSQKDKLRGSASSPLSLNRYAYVQNDPINLIDPSGMRHVDMQVNGEYYSEEEFHQKVDNLRSAASAALKAGNQQEADKLASRAMSFMESGYDYLTPAQKQAYSKAQSQLATASDPEERKRIIREACMSPEELEAQEYIDQLSQRYTQNEWKFLTDNDYINKNMSVESRFAILDHLKKGQGISAEDLINLGIFTEETRYVPGFLGFRDDVASNTAALLELSYHTTTQFGTTLYELSLEEQQQRNAQIQMLLGYIALQGAMGSVQQYNAAGGAIRYPGATNAAPGYESVPSDFGSFSTNSPSATGTIGTGACFASGTLVLTENGYEPIENIKAGDLVLSKDVESGQIDLKKVTKSFVHSKDAILSIFAGGSKIDTTEEHPFWVVDKGWVYAAKLESGDSLLLLSGEIVKITKIEMFVLPAPIAVYNFEVEDWHTYFVSDSSILVHNKAARIPTPSNPKKVDGDFLKKNGIDPHGLKYDTLGDGAKVSNYNIYLYKNGDLWLQKNGSKDFIPTYESIGQ